MEKKEMIKKLMEKVNDNIKKNVDKLIFVTFFSSIFPPSQKGNAAASPRKHLTVPIS